MAQSFILGWISGHLNKEEAAKVEATLERMGLVSTPDKWNILCWELLDWFVAFAQRDLTALTEGQCSQLDEEFQVIQLLAHFNMTPWVPNREELQALASRALTILSELVETGSARIGPLPVEFVVWRGTIKQTALPEAQRARGVVRYEGWGPALIGHPPAEGIAFQVPPSGADALIHALAQLLSKYPGHVRRCPRCTKLFAQFRRSAVLCSRKCQSQAASREQWERYKKKKGACLATAQAKKSKTRRNKKKVASRNGGKRYGTKK